MTPEELDLLIRRGEDEQLEFKGGLIRPQVLAAEIAAFANTHGGTIVLGYDEQSRAVTGVPSAALARRLVDEALREIRPQLTIDLEVVRVDGRMLVVLQVPPAHDFPYEVGGRILQRSGASVRPITADHVVRQLGAAVPPQHYDDLKRLADRVEEQSARIEELTESMSIGSQLPLQLVLLAAGVVLGYFIGGWDPLGLAPG